jgi:hypothetical protein
MWERAKRRVAFPRRLEFANDSQEKDSIRTLTGDEVAAVAGGVASDLALGAYPPNRFVLLFPRNQFDVRHRPLRI